MIIPPDTNKLFGTMLVIVGAFTYIIFDVFDSTPNAFTCNAYVFAANDGVVAVILVCVNDDIASGDDPIVNDNGFCTVS